jgi:hypothetical protein
VYGSGATLLDDAEGGANEQLCSRWCQLLPVKDSWPPSQFVLPTLQLPQRQTKLALPRLPLSSCSSVWLNDTALGCSSRHDVQVT